MWIMNCMWYCTFISKLAYQLGNVWTRDHRPARSDRRIRLVIADNDWDVVSVSLLSQCNVYSENIDQTTQFIARVIRLGTAAADDDNDDDCLPASINLFDESDPALCPPFQLIRLFSLFVVVREGSIHM